MSHMLGEIVSAALRQADAGIKVASLRDAPIEDRGFARVDNWLAESLGQNQKVASQQPSGQGAGQDKTASAQPDTSSIYDDVSFGHKLAEALHYGASVVEKLAGPLNKSDGGVPTPGPTPKDGPAPIQPGLYENAKTQTPRPQASAHARAAQANSQTTDGGGQPMTDRDYQDNSGPVIPSGYPNSKTRTTNQSTKSASRHEVQRLLNSKIAQHKMLVSLGQIDAAHAVLKEAEDIAENASLIFGDNYSSSNFPDNEGIRNLTKAQARDMNQREAGAFFGEPVKRDNAATTHLAVTHGLKLSSRRKIADGVTGTTPVMPNTEPDQALTKSREGKKTTKVAKDKNRSTGSLGTAVGTLVGGRAGGAIGAAASGDKHNRGRRVLGQLAGGTLGKAVGRVGDAALASTGVGRSVGPLGLVGRAGNVAGGTLGNLAVDKLTRHEKKAALKLAKDGKDDKPSTGNLGTAIASTAGLGPLGAAVSGPKHNRGRRFLGSAAGQSLGGMTGAGAGYLASGGKAGIARRTAKALEGLEGVTRGGVGKGMLGAAKAVAPIVGGGFLGQAAGSVAGNHYTNKHTPPDKKK